MNEGAFFDIFVFKMSLKKGLKHVLILVAFLRSPKNEIEKFCLRISNSSQLKKLIYLENFQ